jgi:hypothetical protein
MPAVTGPDIEARPYVMIRTPPIDRKPIRRPIPIVVGIMVIRIEIVGIIIYIDPPRGGNALLRVTIGIPGSAGPVISLLYGQKRLHVILR